MAYPRIQQGMIGLPDSIGSFGFAPVEQIVRGPVGFTAAVGERHQGGVQVLHNAIHLIIIGHRPSVAQRNVTHLSVDKGGGRRRFAQRAPFNQMGEFGM